MLSSKCKVLNEGEASLPSIVNFARGDEGAIIIIPVSLQANREGDHSSLDKL